jgi:ketosteroid isomerase-like protein
MDRNTRGDNQMAITPDRVREIFKGLENGDGAAFFKHVVDDVDWTVMGSHPLAGHYLSKKAFIEGTFAKLAQVLPQAAELHAEHLIVKDDQAVVELHSLATAKNGLRFVERKRTTRSQRSVLRFLKGKGGYRPVDRGV